MWGPQQEWEETLNYHTEAQGGNTHPMLTSDPPKNKEKKTSCEDLQKKRFLLRTESQPNELRELFHPGYSRCLLSGISVLP